MPEFIERNKSYQQDTIAHSKDIAARDKAIAKAEQSYRRMVASKQAMLESARKLMGVDKDLVPIKPVRVEEVKPEEIKIVEPKKKWSWGDFMKPIRMVMP